MDSKYFMGVIVPLSVLLPIFIGIIKLKALSPAARIILWYLFASAILSAASGIMGRYFHQNNMPLIHLYTVLEVILFAWYYKRLSGASKTNAFYIALPAAFIVLCIINAVFFQSIYTYSSYTRSVEAIILMMFALSYFAKMATGNSEKKVGKQPDFYFNAGIFLYFSGAFMLFIFSNFIAANLTKHNFLIIWNIHAALLLLMYILFSIAFFKCKK